MIIVSFVSRLCVVVFLTLFCFVDVAMFDL